MVWIKILKCYLLPTCSERHREPAHINEFDRHLQWRNTKFRLEIMHVYGTTATVEHIAFVSLDNFSLVSFEKVVKMFTILTNSCKYHKILLSELNKCPYIFLNCLSWFFWRLRVDSIYVRCLAKLNKDLYTVHWF